MGKWKIDSNFYDFLIVANGHYSTPWIDGLFTNSKFAGEILHTHTYRAPDRYVGKDILVVGQGPSGIDIAVDLIPFAKSVTIFGKRIIPGVPEEVHQIVGWPAEVGESTVTTDKG